jgi:hypothetical protein
MNDIYFVTGISLSWPHSDDNMLKPCARRADQPLPCTTNPASYAHSPHTLPRPQHQACSCTPFARFMAFQRARPRPIPNSLLPPLCCCRSIFDWSLGMTTFLRSIALWMIFPERNLGLRQLAMRYTYTIPTTLYSLPPLFVSLQRQGVFVARRSHVALIPYHRDGWRKSPYILFVVVILYTPYFILNCCLWLLEVSERLLPMGCELMRIPLMIRCRFAVIVCR